MKIAHLHLCSEFRIRRSFSTGHSVVDSGHLDTDHCRYLLRFMFKFALPSAVEVSRSTDLTFLYYIRMLSSYSLRRSLVSIKVVCFVLLLFRR